MNDNTPASTFHRILVACDFSPCSEVLLPYATSLARSCKATLFLTHVAAPEVVNVEPPVVLPVRETVQKQMQDLELSEQLDGIDHTTLITQNTPAEGLLNLARENEIDLIIMGTHGRTGFRKLVMGSVAERVFRHATCPVLTVGPHVFAQHRREAHIRSVLCAVGALDHPHPAVQYSLRLAGCYSALLTLLHVSPTALTAESNTTIDNLRQHVRDLVPPGTTLPQTPEVLVEVGMPSERIVQIAADRNADMIVLDALPPAMLTSHLMDTAYRVIIDAPCPVMTVLVTHQSAPYRKASSGGTA